MSKSAAAILGSRGGKARMANLTAKEREALAVRAARKRWANKPARLPLHQMIRLMLERIKQTGRPHTLFVENGAGRFCETGGEDERRSMRNAEHACVGTYGPEATFTEVTQDLVSM